MSMNRTTTPATPGTGAPATGTPATGAPTGGGGSDEGATDVAKQHAESAISEAKQQTNEVVQSAKEHAQVVLSSTTDEVRTQTREQTDRLASSLKTASQELSRMADSADDGSMIGPIVRSLADTARRTSSKLEQGGPEGVMNDLRRFGRQHPVQFLAMAAAGGFFAARLMRSTDTQAVKDAVSGGGDDSVGRISGQGSPTSGLNVGTATDPAIAPTTPSPGIAGALSDDDPIDRAPGA
jgi:vacuolar-type H+-ATPase subunit H